MNGSLTARDRSMSKLLRYYYINVGQNAGIENAIPLKIHEFLISTVRFCALI